MCSDGLPVHFLNKRIILVSGKGGVGRTTVSVAMARAAARAGKRTLLLEIAYEDGAESALAHHFGHSKLEAEPIQVKPNLSLGHLWARSGHEAFLRTVLPGGPLIGAALRSRAVEKFLIAAPSMHEMGVFYHLMVLLEAQNSAGLPEHELLIVDMPATGHTLALTGLPDILLRLIPGGPIARALHEGRDILNDPNRSAAWVVTLPEQLPVTEACELLEGLAETNMPTGGVLVNRMPENPFSDAERAALKDHLAGTDHLGRLSLDRIDNADIAMSRLDAKVKGAILPLPDIGAGEDPTQALVAHMSHYMLEGGS